MPGKAEPYWQHLYQVLGLLESQFHSVGIPDHLMEAQADIPEAMTGLSYMAGLFPGLSWGTAVLCQSFHHPK